MQNFGWKTLWEEAIWKTADNIKGYLSFYGIIVVEQHPVTAVMNRNMCCFDFRGLCEDNWIAVPLLHSTMELVWLPVGRRIHPWHLDGGYHDWLSSVTYSSQGCTRLPYWTHLTSHKGETQKLVPYLNTDRCVHCQQNGLWLIKTLCRH